MKKAPYISRYVSYKEVIRSQTAKTKGIDNTPDARQLENIRRIALHVFDPVREALGTPIFVSSCFRSDALNKLIGGSPTSQHLALRDFAAMDMDAQVYEGTTNAAIFQYIANNLIFDQLIWEFGDDNEPDWVHVSYGKTYNRMQMLQAVRTRKGVAYRDPSDAILSLLKQFSHELS
jgi:hypothetical protein